MASEVFSFRVPSSVIHACSTLANSFSNTSSSGVGFTKVVHIKLNGKLLECSARTNDGGAKYTFSDASSDQQGGEVLIPSGDFVKVASVLPKGSEASVTVMDDATVKMESEDTSVSCLGINLDNDYEKPEIKLPAEDKFRGIDNPEELKHALDWVRNSRATGEGSSSFAMSGVLMSLTSDGGWDMMCGSGRGIARFVSLGSESGMSAEAVVLPVDHLSSSVSVAADALEAEVNLSRSGIIIKSKLDDNTTVYTLTSAMNLPAKDFGQESLLKQAKRMLKDTSGEIMIPARRLTSVLSNAVKMSASSDISMSFEPAATTVSSVGGFGYSTDITSSSNITPGDSVNINVDGQKLRGAIAKCDGNAIINVCAPIGGKIPVFISDTAIDENSLDSSAFVVEIGQ